MTMHSVKDSKVGIKYFEDNSLSLQAKEKIDKGEIVVIEEGYVSYPDPGANFGGNGYDELGSYYLLSRRPTDIKICVSCYSCLDSQEYESCQVCCSPICNPSCKNVSIHAAECKILAELRKNDSSAKLLDSKEVQGQIFYDFVAIIRIFALKLASRSTQLLVIEDRYRTGPYAKDREANIKIYTSLFQSLPTEWVTTNGVPYKCSVEELVEHCFNLLNVIKILGVPQGWDGICYSRNLYYLTSFIRHSCIPNVDISTDRNGQVKVKALQVINKGEDLVYCFVNILRPTYDRHVALQLLRLAECYCKRCLDPTEFETYLGSVKCENKRCCGPTRGFVVMDTVNNMKKGTQYSEWTWKCTNCSTVINHCELVGKIDDKAASIGLWSEKDQVDYIFIKKQVEQINHRYSTFHPGHWLPLLLHKKLADLMGLNYGIWTWRIDPLLISHKIDILIKLLQVYGKLKCGPTPFAATIKAEILDLTYQRIKNSRKECGSGELTENEKSVIYLQAMDISKCVNHCDPSSKFGDVGGAMYLLMQKLQVKGPQLP